MKLTKWFTVTAAVASMAMGAAHAALSPEHADFAKSPAQFLMTKEEQAQWKKISNDADAQAFIDLFWARRDPTPGTPVNEFHEEFDTRVKWADDHFQEGKKKGSLTDRGKVLLVLGPPAVAQRSSTQPTSTIQTGTGSSTSVGEAQAAAGDNPTIQSSSPKMVWIYEQQKVKYDLGQPKVEIGFIDQYASNEWKIERTRTDYVGLLTRINQWLITQPDLKAAPVYATTTSATTTPVAMTTPAANSAPVLTTGTAVPVAANSVGSFKTDALKAAVDAMRAGKAASSKNLYLTYGEFITPAGDYFVPVQLYVPKVASLSADADYTFFGYVENASGEPAAIFEEKAKLNPTKNDFFVDRSLTLQPGKYKGTFGLALDGKPVSMISADLNLAGLDKTAAGISNLMLSNDVHTLAQAQNPTDPFSFGGIKVIPKADKIFATTDDLWYFFELRNPGLDPASNLPKLSVQMTVTGQTATGQKVRMNAPASELEGQELKGVPGHYAVGASMPLESFKPGDYTMKMKVTDVTSKQQYELSGDFKIVAGGK